MIYIWLTIPRLTVDLVRGGEGEGEYNRVRGSDRLGGCGVLAN